MVASKFFASLRQRPSHAKVRSTTHLRAAKPREALGRVGPFDDSYRLFADAFQSLAQFISGITIVGKDMAQPGIARTDRSKNTWSALAILNAGFVLTSPTKLPSVSVKMCGACGP
jgi:hypothetical protein